MAWGENLDRAIIPYAIIPARYADPALAVPQFGPFQSLTSALLPYLTSTFLHGGALHLLGNLWILAIFAARIEQRLGAGRFLGFYVAGGVVAMFVHVLT